MKIIHKIALAAINDKKILLARSKKNLEVFYTLGGKIEQNETEIECLKREVKEEANVTIDSNTLVFLHTFFANAHDKVDTQVQLTLYTGELIGDPTPSNEVEELRYFDSSIDRKHLTELSWKVISYLKTKNLIT